MKNGRKWIFGMMVLSLIITVIMMQFMPNQIPAHYNSAGVVDRIGSKFESLIWPCTTALMGGFFLLMVKYAEASSGRGVKLLYIVGVIVELFFIALGVYFMGKSIAF